jgi:tRNA pseudouridine38-40 synthase
MRNIMLLIEYDGTEYYGWQKQSNVPTIQEEIEKAINKITGENIVLIGAGRTDKGVHAKGQVANFSTKSNIPSNKFKFAINSCLPKDIAIVDSREVNKDFHSRYDAVGREYKYLIYNNLIRSPLLERYSYHVPYELDFKKMQNSIDDLLGTHDFISFMASGSYVKDTIRTIDFVCLSKNRNILEFKIRGNGFLYNMVRIIIGTLVDIGSNKCNNSLSCIIESKNRENAGHTAPSKGLFLEKVFYNI